MTTTLSDFPSTRPTAAGLAAIYCRISDDREGAGLGVVRQEADCRPLCERRGYSGDTVRLYVDNDVSAYSGRRRPAYEQLLADIAAGDIRLLVAWHADRLHRSPTELEVFIKAVEAAGVDVATARAGELDLATPTGRMTARIVGAVARHESEHKADRQRSKHRELAAAGRSSGGGTRPFGYQGDRRTIDPVEAEAVREAARRALGGESMRSICRDFTARGIATVKGGTWNPTVLRNLLMSARISGRREHGRRMHGSRSVVAAPITSTSSESAAIITVDDSDELRALLGSETRRRFFPWNSRTYLLRGIAKCSLCGHNLVARPRDDHRRCYVCASGPGFGGCGKIRILADPLERQVELDLVAAVDVDELLRALEEVVGTSAGEARQELARIDDRLKELAERYAADEITTPEWQAMRGVLAGRRKDAEREYHQARGTRALQDLPRPLAPAWEGFDWPRRRAVVEDLVAEVKVGPAVRGRNHFDPDRISIVWRV